MTIQYLLVLQFNVFYVLRGAVHSRIDLIISDNFL